MSSNSKIESLVEAARDGDREAVTELIGRYQKVAITRAWSIVQDFHLGQDIAQDAFVIAFRKLPQLANAASFGPWLLEIVRRQSLNSLQRRETFHSYDGEVDSGEPRFEVGWRDRFSLAVDAIKKLPNHEQEVVVLYYLEDLSTREVAQCLDRPVGTITKQLSRAVKRLKDFLTETSHESK